jgi:hypothetical protein
MNAEDCIAGETIEQAIGDHPLCPAIDANFLGGLEEHVYGPIKLALLRYFSGAA